MHRLRVFNSGAFRLALLFVVIFAVGAIGLVAAVNVAVSAICKPDDHEGADR